MEELTDSHRVAHDSPEIHHLVSYGVGVEDHPDRMLHPAVGDEYPKRGEGCSERRQPCGREVESLADPSPAEQHHSDEGCLDEEGEDAFDGKRRSEYVADEPGIVAEVCSELKLKDDSGRDTQSEVDSEYLHPEPGGVFPEIHLADDVDSLHDGHYHRESQCERDE